MLDNYKGEQNDVLIKILEFSHGSKYSKFIKIFLPDETKYLDSDIFDPIFDCIGSEDPSEAQGEEPRSSVLLGVLEKNEFLLRFLRLSGFSVLEPGPCIPGSIVMTKQF